MTNGTAGLPRRRARRRGESSVHAPPLPDIAQPVLGISGSTLEMDGQMSTDDSNPRFVVILDGRACFWTHTRREAKGICQDGLDGRLRENFVEKLHAEDPFLLHNPTEGCVEEIDPGSYVCLTHPESKLTPESDGWMSCPLCSRVAFG